MSVWSTLQVERDGPLDRVRLNRPDRMNTLDPVMVDELNRYFDGIARDAGCRIIVLEGAGRHFCAGLDLDAWDVRQGAVLDRLADQRRIAEIILKMRYCPQPIVALVQGAASGGGFALALAADIRVLADDARMNAAFIRVGLSGCDVGLSYLLPRLVGAAVAAELMMTGDFLDAVRAKSLGLANVIAAPTDLSAAAQPLVDRLLAAAPLALRLTKECLRMSLDAPSLEAVIAMEDRNQILTGASGDFAEGVAAFREKRAPVYAQPSVTAR